MEVMDGKPDLIIGNYTDGNLVASLMASKLDTTLVDYLTCLMLIIFLLLSKSKRLLTSCIFE